MRAKMSARLRRAVAECTQPYGPAWEGNAIHTLQVATSFERSPLFLQPSAKACTCWGGSCLNSGLCCRSISRSPTALIKCT